MFYQYDFKYSTGLLGDVLHIGIFHQFGRTSYFCKFLIVARKFNMSFLGLSSSISLRYFSNPRIKFPSLSVNPLPLAANDEWRSRLYIELSYQVSHFRVFCLFYLYWDNLYPIPFPLLPKLKLLNIYQDMELSY